MRAYPEIIQFNRNAKKRMMMTIIAIWLYVQLIKWDTES